MITANRKLNAALTLPILSVIVCGLIACGQAPGQKAIDAQTAAQQIINGSEVDASDPVSQSTAGLYINLPDSDIALLFCSATLISPRTLVTAAHCLRSAEESTGMPLKSVLPYLRIGFGLKTVQALNDDKIKFITVSDARIHADFHLDVLESFGDGTPIKDIALVQLSENAPTNYKPVPLLRDTRVLANGLKLTIAGFGMTRGEPFVVESEFLRKTNIEISDAKQNPVQFLYNVVNEHGSCSGDSGGPAYLVGEDGALTLAGVTSYGDQGCMTYGVWTSIPAMIKWVDKNRAEMDLPNHQLDEELFTPGMMASPSVSQFTSSPPLR